MTGSASKSSLLGIMVVIFSFAAAFIGHAGPLDRLTARTTRPASGEGSLDAARGGKQELVFLDEKDYIRLFRTELEEHARRALFRRKKRFLPFDDCVKWVRAMGLWDSKKEWEEWIAMGEKRNPYIPTRPDEYYGKLGQWKGWSHFLGVPRVMQKRTFGSSGFDLAFCSLALHQHLDMSRLFLFALLVGSAAETVSDCIESQCRGCGGEQCQLCRQDTKTISTCVSKCIDNTCRGCGGEQCQLCREDSKNIESCCGNYETDMCKTSPKDPCDGLYGAESLQCVWEESVKTCMEKSCTGCGGEQCQLCRQDATRVATCCDDHWHSVDPPQMCKDAKAEAVSSCVDSKCRGCGGEQCQLCRQDPQVLDQCCTGAMRTPMCEKTRSQAKAILP
eukprot:symbB.v1.2.034943.t1/scaffold4603.1/size37504/4